MKLAVDAVILPGIDWPAALLIIGCAVIVLGLLTYLTEGGVEATVLGVIGMRDGDEHE